MSQTKITNSVALGYVLENCELPTEVRERIVAIQTSIDKKNAHRSDKPSKSKIENDSIRQALLDILTEVPMSQNEIKAICPVVAEKSPQAFGQLMSPMVKAGLVTKTIVKKIPLYALANSTNEVE